MGMSQWTPLATVLLLTAVLAGCTGSDADEDQPLLIDDSDGQAPPPDSTLEPIIRQGNATGNSTVPEGNATIDPETNETVEASAPPLVANTTGPYSGQALIPIALSANATGGTDPVNATCAWSGEGATIAKAGSCNAVAVFTAPGDYELLVELTDGDQVATASVPVSISAPAPSGDVTGNLNSYNGGVIALSGAIGDASGRPTPHLAGESISISSRFTSATVLDVTATSAEFYLLDESLTPVLGPLTAASSEDCPTTGCNGWRYGYTWAIPQTFPGGVYYPSFLVTDGISHDWVADTGTGGFWPIEVIGA